MTNNDSQRDSETGKIHGGFLMQELFVSVFTAHEDVSTHGLEDAGV